MKITCPLSHSSKISVIDRVNSKSIQRYWQKHLGIDVTSEFNDIQKIKFCHCSESDLRFFHPMITGSEYLYEKLQNFDWYYVEEKDEYDYASKYIKNSDIVLEIGCGKGAFFQKIKPQKYIGLEFSQKAKTLASNPNINILNESIEQHSINNSEKYDVVCSFQVLEHVSDSYSFIESSINCLKAEGLLIYSVPSFETFFPCLKNYIINMPPHHVTWWSDKSLQYIARRFELEIIDIHHDKLAEIHKKLYSSHLILNAIENTLGFKNKTQLLDRSLRYKLSSKISTFLGTWLKKGMDDSRVLPSGHSVTVVYQKKKND